MTETTRPNLKSTGENGSRIWYRDSDNERELPMSRVRKVTTRIGDDARVQGPFKLAATKVRVEQIHNNPSISEQDFELINRPGVLLSVDGQVNANIHGTEIALALVDKSSEKVISKTTVRREITALGVWSRASGRKVSTPVYTNISVSDAIKRVLEAIGIPYGQIDETPTAILNYFWLSDRDTAIEVLAGLADAAGPRARLDDYTGAITFTAEPSAVDRLTIYGGPGIGNFANEPEGVTERAVEGTGVYSGGSGVLPPGTLYGGFLPFQASLAYRYDGLNDRSSWFIQPYSTFVYNEIEYSVELLRSGFDSIKQRYYIEISLVSEVGSTAFSESTFDASDQDPVYCNFSLSGVTYLRKRLSHTTDLWDNLSVRSTALASVTPEAVGAWLFRSSEIQGGVQHKGRYRFEVTRAMAEAVGNFTYALTSDQASSLGIVEPPSESSRLIFSDWSRSDDDSRYFNTIKVTSVTRELDAADSDLWESPEDIEVVAGASLTIRVSSDDGTPFLLADVPFTHSVNANLSSIVPDRTSGAEIEITITAGTSDLTLQNLVVRGKYYAVTLERVLSRVDNSAVVEDDTVEWRPAGKFPADLDLGYLESWIEGRLELGLERRWTATLEVFGWDPGEDGYLRNNWQTMMRLRPGRLVRIEHGRDIWLGLTREIERKSGAEVDNVDRYLVTCELTGVSSFDTTILRVGLDNYGTDKVLG